MEPRTGPAYDHGGYLTFLFTMAFTFAFFIYTAMIYPGVDLGENIQAYLQQEEKEELKIDLSQIKEPWKPDPNLVAHGKILYANNCAMCHGNEGKGDGPAGGGLNPPPRNLVTGPWKKGGGLIGHFKVLTEGIPGSSMSSYKHLPVIDRWALAHYIQSFTQAQVDEKPEEVEAFAKTVTQ